MAALGVLRFAHARAGSWQQRTSSCATSTAWCGLLPNLLTNSGSRGRARGQKKCAFLISFQFLWLEAGQKHPFILHSFTPSFTPSLLHSTPSFDLGIDCHWWRWNTHGRTRVQDRVARLSGRTEGRGRHFGGAVHQAQVPLVDGHGAFTNKLPSMPACSYTWARKCTRTAVYTHTNTCTHTHGRVSSRANACAVHRLPCCFGSIGSLADCRLARSTTTCAASP